MFSTIRKNKYIVILFLISTSFFIYQHATNLAWDFSAYLLNAKYLFSDGFYFELFRPPLTPFIIGVFGFFGWKLAEYLYIVFVSAIFLISTIKLANVLKFKKLYFYAISLNIYVLMFGLLEGSELLSLSLLELFVSYLIKNKNSGHFLGLASLSRYNFLGLFPLFVFYKDHKKIIKNMIIFIAVLSPWLVYNFLVYGNFFMSIADLYANNVYYRKDYLFKSFNWHDILYATNIMLPFLLIGLFSVLYKICNNFKKMKFKILEDKKLEIIMLILFAFSLWNYNNIPNKATRHLFSLMLPCFYFSYLGIKKLSCMFSKRKPKILFKKIVFLILLMNMLALSFMVRAYSLNKKPIYEESTKKMQELGLDNRSVMSNAWVFINYFGLPCKPAVRKALVEKRIGQGEIMLLFPHINPEYTSNRTFLRQFPIIFEDKNYIIIGNATKHKKMTVVDETYLENLEKNIFDLYGYNVTTDPCVILFNNNTLKTACYWINLKYY